MKKILPFIPPLFLQLCAFCSWSEAFELKELLSNRLDPAIEYRTLTTDHFSVHYPLQLEEVSLRVAGVAEEFRSRLLVLLGPQENVRTHLVVSDHADDPAIFTFVFPIPQIFYDVSLPAWSKGLNEFGDWHSWLLTHEYTHLLELEMRGGLYNVLAPVFGTWMRPHLTMPVWLTEGLAVYTESTLTPKGRGESTSYRMMMRMAHLEGLLGDSDFVRKDTIFAFDNKKWPWGVRPYLFGYYLVRNLARKNPGAIPRMLQRQARALPYDFEGGIREAGWPSFDALWEQTLEGIHQEAQSELEEIRREPVTPVEYLTDTGQMHYGLSLAPDGKSVYVTRDHPDYENAVLRIATDSGSDRAGEAVAFRTTGYQTSVSRSGRYLVYDGTTRAKRHYQISDIHIFDLKTRATVGMSPGFHARDADIHPDGKHLVYVINDRGKNRLVMSNTGWGERVDLLGDVGYRRLSAPRFSPDGTSIVLNIHNNTTGGEDLWLVDSTGGGKKVLLEDGAENQHPSWSAAGDRIFFSSNRSGVANVHSLELKTGKVKRLSNVEGGLYFPVPDPAGEWIYAISYRGHGYDVARFKPGSFELRIRSGTRSHSPPESAAHAGTGPGPAPAAAATPAPRTESYSGIRYLLPQYLVPSLVMRPGSTQIGGITGAVDPLYFHHYNLDLRYDTATALPVGRLFYFDGSHPLALDLTASHDALGVAGSADPYRAFNLDLAFNIPISRDVSHYYLRAGGAFQSVHFQGRSNFVGGSLGVSYDTEFKEIGYSFPEAGTSATIKFSRLFALSGGDPSTNMFSFDLRSHATLPWPRHALHGEIQGGTFLGESPGPNSLLTVGGGSSFPYSLGSGITLYGMPPNAIATRRAAVGTGFYTVSLWDVQRGLGSWPIFLGRLSAGIRLQALAISPQDLPGAGVPGSAGVEIFQSLLFGHIFDLTARLGLYQGSAAIGGETQAIFSILSGG